MLFDYAWYYYNKVFMVATLIVNDEDAQDMMMLGEKGKKEYSWGRLPR